MYYDCYFLLLNVIWLMFKGVVSDRRFGSVNWQPLLVGFNAGVRLVSKLKVINSKPQSTYFKNIVIHVRSEYQSRLYLSARRDFKFSFFESSSVATANQIFPHRPGVSSLFFIALYQTHSSYRFLPIDEPGKNFRKRSRESSPLQS